MPLYDYKCDNCKKTFEKYYSLKDYQCITSCEKCGGNAKRTYKPGSFAVSIFQPYVDINMTGEPIYVETRKQKQRLLKEHGLSEL